jgi:hypothetical protein
MRVYSFTGIIVVLQQEQTFQIAKPCLFLFVSLQFLHGSLGLHALGLLERHHSFFNRVFHDKSDDRDGSFLADAMDSVHFFSKLESVRERRKQSIQILVLKKHNYLLA